MNQLLEILLLWVFFSRSNADEMMINLPPCKYPAIYNFGDSNSDTGGITAAFGPNSWPYGETFFHKSAGRDSDGRLIIDFLADHLGIPFLSPYLDSVGSNYQKGANFASGGATILRTNESWFQGRVSPFNLEIQVVQFTQFKERTTYFYDQDKEDYVRKRLPNPEELSRALFTLDIGQNDAVLGLRDLSYQEVLASLPNIVNEFITQVRNLYKSGARIFWIHNMGPIGCLPLAHIKVQDPVMGVLDENGCVMSHNYIALEFNKQLKDEIVKLRAELSEAAITYVDMYHAKHELIADAESLGFEDPSSICCGYHGFSYDIWCGMIVKVNGSEVFAGSCPNPSRIISWDGVHFTEAANQWIANRILNGSLSDPPIAVTKACHRQKRIL